MAPEINNDRDKQKNLDQEVREMISALTGRLGTIQRSHKLGSSSSHGQDEDDEQGVRIITLAGSNLGATMRGDMDDKGLGPQGLPEQEDSSSYLVNSNFQAVNNSIMLDGSYRTNNPGVHLDVTDYVDHDDDNQDVVVAKHEKKGGKGRRGGHHRHAAGHSDNVTGTDSEKNN